jgi:integrase
VTALAHLSPLPPDDAEVEIVAMLTLSRAVDLWLGDLTRKRYSPRTIKSYRDTLYKLCDRLPHETDVTEVRTDDLRAFLDLWGNRSTGTQGQVYAPVAGIFKWLYRQQRIRRNPMERIDPPKRVRGEDLDVVTVSATDVRRMLAACTNWTERLTVGILVYLGPRRHATALLRLRDYDRAGGRLRFHEKGAKTIWKPVPDELAALLEAAIVDGVIRNPDDYLIPPEGPLSRAGDRDDRVIWRVVKRVAASVGVEAHTHALRAAFATFYLEQNPGELVGLQKLMGHESIEVTRLYLRKLDKQRAMEPVRGLSWAVPAPELAEALLEQTRRVEAPAE